VLHVSGYTVTAKSFGKLVAWEFTKRRKLWKWW